MSALYILIFLKLCRTPYLGDSAACNGLKHIFNSKKEKSAALVEQKDWIEFQTIGPTINKDHWK